MSQLTLCARACMQLSVAIEGSRNWLVVLHANFEENIQDVVALGEHDIVVGSDKSLDS